MAPDARLFLSNRNYERSVHRERLNRRTSCWRPSDHGFAVPAKVFVPALRAGIEDGSEGTAHRVLGFSSGGLSERARDTSQCQVLGCSLTAAGGGPDVVDVKRRDLTALAKGAVLAPFFSALKDEAAKSGRNVRPFHAATAKTRLPA